MKELPKWNTTKIWNRGTKTTLSWHSDISLQFPVLGQRSCLSWKRSQVPLLRDVKKTWIEGSSCVLLDTWWLWNWPLSTVACLSLEGGVGTSVESLYWTVCPVAVSVACCLLVMIDTCFVVSGQFKSVSKCICAGVSKLVSLSLCDASGSWGGSAPQTCFWH